MRIIHVVSTSPEDTTAGGVEKFVRDLLPVLGKKKINTLLLGAIKTFINKENEMNGMQDYEFYPAIKSNQKRMLAIRYYFKLMFKAKNVIRFEDIIHIHRLEPLLFLFLFRNPKIITIHINVKHDMQLRKGALIGTIYHLFERFIINRPNLFGIKKIIFVSEKLKDEYINEYPTIAQYSVAIRTGIGTDMKILPIENVNKIKENYQLSDETFIILSLGRLTEQKNIPLILDAFKIFQQDEKKVVLLIGGSGPAEDEIKQYINKLKLKNIHFLGKIKQEDIVGLYNVADLFAITSKYEGGPITIYEALSCGCPVISTDVGVASEVIQNNITGFIICEQSAIAFAEKMKIILHDRTRFRNNVQKSAGDFSIDTIADRYIDVYAQV